MSTRKHPNVPKSISKNIPDEILYSDGVQRLYIYTCRNNDRHRVVVPDRSLEAIPGGCCPSCEGELRLLSTFWEGDVPADGYDPDAALEAMLGDGFYAWRIGSGRT